MVMNLSSSVKAQKGGMGGKDINGSAARRPATGAEVAQEAAGKRRAEQHPAARTGYIPQNVVMIYAPRRSRQSLGS